MKSGSNERGVLYIVWGNAPKVRQALSRSIASLSLTNPDLPYHVADLGDLEAGKGLLEKSRMLELSPFQETLFLDSDTYVFGKLDFGFTMARQFGIACCINECPWLMRYDKSHGDGIEYNTGVIFFSREPRGVFTAWEKLARSTASSMVFLQNGQRRVMPYNDQCPFSLALAMTKVHPFVLPLNWNFRPGWHRSFFGPLRIWHDYSEPPDDIFAINRHYRDPAAVIDFHAGQ